MKAQIEIITAFCNAIANSGQSKVPYKQETTTKLLATIGVGDTICIHNVHPFKEVDANDHDYLKVVEINPTSIKFELNNALSVLVDNDLPKFIVNNQTLKLEDKMEIELSINQELFVDDSFDTTQQSVTIKVVGTCN